MSYGRSDRAKKRPRARRLPPEERRAQLLACAVRVVARRGLSGTHHAEVAREAHVSLATSFVYFPTRQALVAAVLEEVDRVYMAIAGQVHEEGLPAPEALLRFGRMFADSVETQPDYARVLLDWSTAIRDEVWPRFLEFQERMVAIGASTIRRGQREGSISPGVDPEEGARLGVAAGTMIALMKFSSYPPASIERFLETIVRSITGLPPADPAMTRGGARLP